MAENETLPAALSDLHDALNDWKAALFVWRDYPEIKRIRDKLEDLIERVGLEIEQ